MAASLIRRFSAVSAQCQDECEWKGQAGAAVSRWAASCPSKARCLHVACVLTPRARMWSFLIEHILIQTLVLPEAASPPASSLLPSSRPTPHLALTRHNLEIKSPLHGSQEPTCCCRRHGRRGFDPWVGKIPWRRKWHPTPVSLPAESHGQRNLAGYGPWGCRVLHD